MKKILITILITLSSMILYGQSSNYPKYYIQSGDTIGVIISLDQAQKINNDEDMLVLLQKMRLNCDSVSSDYLLVVDKYNKQVALLNLKIMKLNESESTQIDMINNLKKQIIDYQISEKLSETQLQDSEKEIKIKDNIIKSLKFKRDVSYGVGGAVILTFVYYIIKHS